MKNPDSFLDRQKTAAAAKARLVEKFKTRPPADDPAVLAKAAARQVIAEARAKRAAERELEEKIRRERAEELAEAERRAKAEEQAALEAAAQAEALERQKAEGERMRRLVADEAERKARRDARYAARKQRA